jgi:AraC-like DNA-binding protein
MSNNTYAHHPVTLLHIAAYLRERGIPPVEIFRRAGIPPSTLLDANCWIARDLCFALGEQLGVVAGDRFVGAKIGDMFKLTDLNAWGRAVTAAPSIEHACRVASNAIGLLHQGSDLRLLTLRRHAELRFAFRGKMRADSLQHLLGALSVLRKIALLGNARDAVRVRLSMPYARNVDGLEEIYGPAIELGCEHDAIVIDREIMDAPFAGVTGKTSSDESADTAAATGTLVKRLLPHAKVTIEGLASRQRISVRTLQRRLRAWGFSFEEILDDVRRTEAIRHVLSGQHTAMEIAFLLGYSDHAHFTRAFKRWTNLSPREYGKAHRKPA